MVAVLIKSLFLLYVLMVNIGYTQEKIYNFNSQLTISNDATLTVTENIKIRSEGKIFKHGLYRVLPLRRNINNKSQKVAYQLISVQKNGKSEPYFTKEKDGYLYIYVGDKNKSLPKGNYTYTLKYSSKGQIGYFDKYDEIYWNVNGFHWNFPIQKISAKVILPTKSKALQKSCYVGKAGATKQNCKSKITNSNTVIFSTRNIAAKENLTIAVGFNKGVVAVVSSENTWDIPLWGFALLMLGGFWGYGFFTWRLWGKNPTAPTPYPQFNPPQNMSPAFMNYAQKEKVDAENGFTASIINLAIKGYLQIEEKKTKNLGMFTQRTILLHKKRKSIGKLPKEERVIFKKIFDDIDVFVLDGKPDGYLLFVLSSYTNSLESQLKPLMKKGRNRGLIIVPILFFIAFLVGSYFIVPTYLGTFIIAAFLGTAASIFVLNLLVFKVIQKVSKPLRPKTEVKWYKIVSFLSSLGLFFYFGKDSIDEGAYFFLFLCAFFIWSIFKYVKIIHKRPKELVAMQSDIKGFKMYLGAAEERQLQMFNPPQLTPEIFEKLLPYAIVLGVDKIWGKRFEKMVERAGINYSETNYWYVAPQAMAVSSLVSHINSGLSQSVMEGSVDTSSSDSGSEGGGYSGGGGGGGGGGGW